MYISEEDLRKVVIGVVGGPLTPGQEKEFALQMRALDDPRRGHIIYRERDSFLRTIIGGAYFIARFPGGFGLCPKIGGGCSGYIADELIKELLESRWLYDDGQHGYGIEWSRFPLPKE